MRRCGLIVIAACVAACGGGRDVSQDGAVVVDAALADGGSDDALAPTDASPDALVIERPAAPALPRLTPCPLGWRLVPGTPPDEVAVCDPWPVGGRVPCAAGEAHFPGQPGCARLGPVCGAGEWASGLPAVGVIYVRPGAGNGNGTTARPYATIAAALAAATPGTTIALARGSYAETVALPTRIQVLVINIVMFAVEAVAGVAARSTSLLGDALDMFGDASVYALSLYALNRGDFWRARAALAKGVLMAVLGFAVLSEAIVKAWSATTPHAGTMGVIGAVALLANTTCLVLLLRHRRDDVNMSSVWVCSRNDIIANVAVLGAAALVAVTHSGVPDVVVGVGIAALFLWSATRVIRDALAAGRASRMVAAR